MANSLIVGAIRALLTADTAEFTKKMAAAEGDVKALAGALQKDLEPRQRAVNNAVRDFLGGTEIRRAEEYYQAVKKIGDASKLTEADQRKVNRAVEDALAHYRALGLEAPAHLQKLATATAGAAKQTGILDSQFAKMTAAFSAGALIDRAVTGLFNMGAQAFESAGQIVDLSAKTGLSIEAVQKFGFVAEQSGTTVEAFADAVYKLGIATAKSSNEQRRAVEDLGIVWEEFKQLSPEKQLDAIMRALAEVTNVQERNAKGVAVLGKSYAQLAGSVNDYVSGVENANIADASRVRAMAAYGDAYDRLLDKIEKGAIDTIGAIGLALEHAARGRMGDAFGAILSGNVGLLLQNAAAVEAALQGQAGNKHWGKDIQIPAAAPAGGDATARIRAATAELHKLTAAQQANLKAAQALGSGIEDLVAEYDLSADAVALLSKFFADQEKAIGKLEAARKKAEEAQADRVEDLNDLLDETAKANEERIRDEEKLAKAYQWTTAALQSLIVAEGKRMIPVVNPNPLGTMLANPAFVPTAPIDLWKESDYERRLREQAETVEATAKANEKAWRDSLKNTAQLFVDLSDVADGSMGQIMKSAGAGIVAFDGLSEALKAMGEAKTWQSMTAGAAQFATGMVSMIGTVQHLIESVKDEQSAQDWKNARIRWTTQVAESIGVDVAMMADLRDETIDAIGTYAQDRALQIGAAAAQAEANARKLADIIEAVGGLTEANTAAFEARALPLFDVIANEGQFAQDEIAELIKLIDVFADQAESTGGLWSTNLQTIISKSLELGVGIDRITQLIDGQLQQLGSGTGAMVGGLMQALAPATKAIDDLKKKQADLEGRGDTAGAADVGKQMAAEAAKAAADNQAEFDRLNRIALASFNAFVGQGKSAREAITAIGPAIDRLQGSADTFGFAWSEAFGELSRMRTLFTDNADLLDSITGVNDVMTALANVGALTADTFADLQAQGVTAFEQLTAAGFSETEALAQIAPLLDNVIQLHKDRGLAIDDETQKLIDQAGEQGLLAEEQLSTVDVLKQGLGEIIKLLGGELPAAWQGMSDDAEIAARKMEEDMKIAAENIDREFRDMQFTVPVDFAASGDIPGFDPDAFRVDVPGYARRGKGRAVRGGGRRRRGRQYHGDYDARRPGSGTQSGEAFTADIATGRPLGGFDASVHGLVRSLRDGGYYGKVDEYEFGNN